MKTTTLETREQGNLRYKLVENSFTNGDKNYSISEELIIGNNLLQDNSQLSVSVFDTIRKAKNNFNNNSKGWLIV